MICYYCKQDPGTKPHSEVVWNGFKDADLHLYVCFSCRQRHYMAKQKTAHANEYSELPVVIPPSQLMLSFR